MITRMVEQREGEWFTDGTADDWIAEHAALAAGGGVRALTPEQESMIRKLAGPPPEGEFWLIREGDYWHKLYRVGLYDGWAYWRKRMYLGTDGPLSCEHGHEAYNLRSVACGVQTTANVFGYKWRRIGEEMKS